MSDPNQPDTPAPTPDAPPKSKTPKCISERTYSLTVILALIAGAALVYLWYEPFVYGSKRILQNHIIIVEGQRDEVLYQRKVMNRELDAYKAAVLELGYDEEVAEFMAGPEEEEEEEEEAEELDGEEE